MTVPPPPSGSWPEPTPTGPPGGRLPGAQAALGGLVYVAAQVVAGVVALPVVLTVGTDDPTGALLTDPVGSTVFFGVYAALSLLGYFLVTGALAPEDRRITFAGPGIGRELAGGAFLGAALMTGAVAILAGIGVYRGTDLALDPGLLAGVSMGVGAACGEEVFFRGFLFRLLNARFGSTCALAVVGVVFGLLHAGNPGAGIGGGLAVVLAAGILLNAAYLVTGRIWFPVGIHFAWNAVQGGIFGIVVSGTQSGRGLWVGRLDSPEWISGGSMGIEGSVVTIGLGLLAGAVLVVACVRRGRWRSLRTARRDVSRANGVGRIGAHS